MSFIFSRPKKNKTTSVNSLVGVDLGEGGGAPVRGGEENNLSRIVCIIMAS